MTLYKKTDTLLSAKNISKSYDGKLILRDINLEIKDIIRPDMTQGQVVSIIGVSGVGKSTLFNILAGLLRPDSVQVLINKEQRPVRRGDMGVVFQNYWFYDWRPVQSVFNIAVEKNTCVQKAERKDFISTVVEEFELQQHLTKYGYQLSGGQRQRVAIAEQLINGGNFILFDEPFSGLDPLVQDKVNNNLLKVSTQDELKTLIIVSHDLSNAIAISDSVFVIGKEEDKEGAIIKKEVDLIERGLAWHKDIKGTPAFLETLKEIKACL